jgi:carboxyl-terminal processing protease
MNVSRTLVLIALAVSATSCGGGGGDGGNGGGGGGGGGNQSGWTPGIFQPSANFRNRCVSPRSGTNPGTGQPYPDITGTVTDQNNWLRSWTNELYLWYSEVSDIDPALYSTSDYFDRMKTTAVSASGRPKDRFHFTYPTPVWLSLSRQGQQVSYGLSFGLLATTPPRRAVVTLVEPNPPAATVSSGIARGTEILTVDGVDLVNVNTQAGVDTLNAGMFPDTAGESHTFGIRDVGSSTTRNITLVAANFTTSPVQNVRTISTATGLVGYMLFNDHLATAEGALFNAVNQLKNAGITDLVVDIRYNGGGFGVVASELAYMIAGPTQTAGRTFETIQFNNKHTTTNPVTGQALSPAPFATTTQGLHSSMAAGQGLPTLNLPRVFVLTGANTCSASELLMNGLRGVDVQVIQIGSTTCGKPYGFYDFDNCGTTYFSIQLRSVNAKGEGDYADGFKPANSSSVGAISVPGCSVADDFNHELGDEAEDRLAAALFYRQNSSCAGPATGMARPFAAGTVTEENDVIVPKTPWLENVIRER